MDRGKNIPEGRGSYDGLLAKGGQWNGTVAFVPEVLDAPLRWKRQRKIFVNSMSDVFHESLDVRDIDKIFAVMALSYASSDEPHIFQILTKRSDIMLRYLTDPALMARIQGEAKVLRPGVKLHLESMWPLPNLWLGVSVESQPYTSRITNLLDAPAAVRWVSLEPLIGPINLFGVQDGDHTYNALSKREGIGYRGVGLDWVVVGGESGDLARPMHPHWAESLRRQCAQTNVPFLFKQWGSWCPRGPASLGHPVVDGVPVMCVTELGVDRAKTTEGDPSKDAWMNRAGKKRSGRSLNGVIYDDYPHALASIQKAPLL